MSSETPLRLDGERPSRLVFWMPRLVLVALTFAVFGRLLGYGYVQWDDPGTIFENPDFEHITFETFLKPWTTPRLDIFMPITEMLWTLLALIAGHTVDGQHVVEPFLFRLTSLFLHAGSTLLVYTIVHRLVRDRVAAFVGAAIFCAHPLQAEPLGWISGDKDLLAGFFSLAAMWATLRQLGSERNRSAWTLAVIVLATLAMLSKPQALALLPMLVVLARLAGASWRRALSLILPPMLPAGLVAIVGLHAQPASIVPDVPIFLRPVVALDALGWYGTTVLWPSGLALDYHHSPQIVLASPKGFVIAAIVAGIIAGAWLMRRTWPIAVSGLAIAACGPSPVLGLLKFDCQYYSTVADHYMYLGMAGIAIFVAAIIQSIRVPSLKAMSMLVIVPLAILASRQAGVWRTTHTLFDRALEINPIALGPTRVLAFEAANRNDNAEAVRLLDTVLIQYPRDPGANYNRANALVRLGRDDEAAKAFETAIAAKPLNSAFRHNYAILLIRTGRFDEAEQQLTRAVQLDLTSAPPREALAKLRSLRTGPPATQP